MVEKSDYERGPALVGATPPKPQRDSSFWLSIIALGISVLAIIGTAWQAWESRQAGIQTHDDAVQARNDAKTASDAQAKDVERARKAAEDSAAAAKSLADGMNRSAKAAETSAGAGRDALALNRRALILSNQPEVIALNSRLTQALAVDVAPEVNTQFINLGKGTAFKLENRGWINLQPVKVFPYPPVVPPPSITDIPPGGGNLLNLALKLSFKLTSGMVQAVESGALILYVYGISQYFDNTLDKPRKYTMHWCVYFDPSKTDKQAMVVCPEHNFTEVE